MDHEAELQQVLDILWCNPVAKERMRLEREVVEAAKAWNNTNYRDALKREERLTNLGDAVDVLDAFESSQQQIKK